MTKIRTLIVDDEPLAREYLQSLLEREADFELVGECSDGHSAAKYLSKNEVDLVFLDVQMPEMNGLEVVEQVGVDNMPIVVFVTAFDQYALKAFEHHALDYLLKPFDEERFLKAIDRVRETIKGSRIGDLNRRMENLLKEFQDSGRDADKQGKENRFLRRIPVKTSGKVAIISVEQIDWIEASDYYVSIHSDGKSHLLRESMQWLENKLDPAHFVRIHRGAIVNLSYVSELRCHSDGDYRVILNDSTALRLSRRRKGKLEEILGRSF